jgi:hypothetical protein
MAAGVASGRRAAPVVAAAVAVMPAGLVAAWAVVTGWLAVRSLGWPLIHDAPLMHYIAWRIGEGASPYRDLFDMNFPGTYLLHLGVLRALGASDTAWRLFDLAWLAATSLAIGAFARPWGGVAAAGGALVFASYHLAQGAWQTGQRDFLLAPFLVVGALGVARWAERARTAGGAARWHADLVAGGLALGAGLTIKPHALLLVAALGGLVALTAWRAGRARGAAPLAFLLAVAVVPAVVVGWLAAVGALAAWRDIVATYLLPFYGRLGRPATWLFYRWQTWIPLAAAAALALASARRGGRLGVRHAVAGLGLAYGVAHHVVQGKGWEYHLYPLAAFVAVVGFAEIGPAWRERRALAVPLGAALVLALALLGQKGAEAGEAGWIRDKARVVDALTRDLAGLQPGETVQVLDTTGGGIHALLRLGVRQPTRFIYDFHFFHDVEAPAIRALRAELLAGLVARPPRFIVAFDEGWPPPATGRDAASEGGAVRRLEAFPGLVRLLQGYEVVHRRPEYAVYAKRRDP